jgi:hypothetical protein
MSTNSVVLLADAVIRAARVLRNIHASNEHSIIPQVDDYAITRVLILRALDPRTFPDTSRRDTSLDIMPRGYVMVRDYKEAITKIATLASYQIGIPTSKPATYQELIAHLIVLANYDESLMESWACAISSYVTPGRMSEFIECARAAPDPVRFIDAQYHEQYDEFA